MSLISYGNACNMSAQWRERVRQRIEKNHDRIDAARKNYSENQKKRKVSHPELDSIMEEVYLSSAPSENGEFDFVGFGEKLDELYDEVVSEISKYDKKSIEARNLSGIEKMISAVQRTILMTNNSQKLESYVAKAVPEFYVSFLKNVEGKFGDEIYSRL